MIALNEDMGEDRKVCTFSCRSSIYAESLVNGLRKAGVNIYDPSFSDETLNFSVDACDYENVNRVLKIFDGDKNA